MGIPPDRSGGKRGVGLPHPAGGKIQPGLPDVAAAKRYAFVGLGGRLHPSYRIARAIAHFADTHELRRVSTFYQTPAVGGGPPFVSGVIAIDSIEPTVEGLLERLDELEARLGHGRPGSAVPPGVDLDLLAWEGHPHPRLPHHDLDRYGFVARAVAELAPGVATAEGHPVSEVGRAADSQPYRPLANLTKALCYAAYFPP